VKRVFEGVQNVTREKKNQKKIRNRLPGIGGGERALNKNGEKDRGFPRGKVR